MRRNSLLCLWLLDTVELSILSLFHLCQHGYHCLFLENIHGKMLIELNTVLYAILILGTQFFYIHTGNSIFVQKRCKSLGAEI